VVYRRVRPAGREELHVDVAADGGSAGGGGTQEEVDPAGPSWEEVVDVPADGGGREGVVVEV